MTEIITHVSAAVIGAALMFIAFATAYQSSVEFELSSGNKAICVVVKK